MSELKVGVCWVTCQSHCRQRNEHRSGAAVKAREEAATNIDNRLLVSSLGVILCCEACARRSFSELGFESRHHELVDDLDGKFPRIRLVVIACKHNNDQVVFWLNGETLSAIAETCSP